MGRMVAFYLCGMAVGLLSCSRDLRGACMAELNEIREFFKDNSEAWQIVRQSRKGDHNKRALKLVCDGKSFAEAAREVGLSGIRVSQIVQQLYEEAHRAVSGDWMIVAGISARTRSILRHVQFYPNETPSIQFDGTEQSLRKILSTRTGCNAALDLHGMGRKGLLDLLAALNMTMPSPAPQPPSKSEIVSRWRRREITGDEAMRRIFGDDVEA
jgi:hypothetical protein